MVTAERTKVVVRKLPPGLTAEGFKATVDKVASGTYTWFRYHQGKVSAKQLVFSRAYLNFNNSAQVYAFKTTFDGHVFVTSKGTQFRCSVEYAPHQEVPQPVAKKNPLEGTIEQDATYQAFVKALEEGPSLLPSAARQREQEERAAAAAGTAGAAASVVVTPLMEYLKERYSSTGTSAAARGKPRGKPAPTAAVAAPSGRGGSHRLPPPPASVEIAAAASKAADHVLSKDLLKPPLKGANQTGAKGTGASKQQQGGRQQQGATPQGSAPPAKLLTRPAHQEPAGAPATKPGASKGGHDSKAAAQAGGPASSSAKQHKPSSAGSDRSTAAAAATTAPKRVNLPQPDQTPLTHNKPLPQPGEGVKLLQARPGAKPAAAPAPEPAAPTQPAAATAAAPTKEPGTGDALSAAQEAAAAALGPPKRVRAGFQAYRPGGGRLAKTAETG